MLEIGKTLHLKFFPFDQKWPSHNKTGKVKLSIGSGFGFCLLKTILHLGNFLQILPFTMILIPDFVCLVDSILKVF